MGTKLRITLSGLIVHHADATTQRLSWSDVVVSGTSMGLTPQAAEKLGQKARSYCIADRAAPIAARLRDRAVRRALASGTYREHWHCPSGWSAVFHSFAVFAGFAALILIRIADHSPTASPISSSAEIDSLLPAWVAPVRLAVVLATCFAFTAMSAVPLVLMFPYWRAMRFRRYVTRIDADVRGVELELRSGVSVRLPWDALLHIHDRGRLTFRIAGETIDVVPYMDHLRTWMPLVRQIAKRFPNTITAAQRRRRTASRRTIMLTIVAGLIAEIVVYFFLRPLAENPPFPGMIILMLAAYGALLLLQTLLLGDPHGELRKALRLPPSFLRLNATKGRRRRRRTMPASQRH